MSISVDATLEAQAAQVLDRIGVTAEMAVRLLFVHLAKQGTLPDSLRVPNAATQKALADADAIIARRRARSPAR
jgi:antitoxin component of RelBE/YafQ-DinJ toxin-antitoxin module